MIDSSDTSLSIRQQSQLLEIARSSVYYAVVPTSSDEHQLMRRIDEIYTAYPFYGYRRIGNELRTVDHLMINNKRVYRLMKKMGIMAIYPKPNTSKRNPEHTVYPYLLGGLTIDRPNHVWATDITYIPMYQGFFYLVAVMDWYSRYILSWQLSNTMDSWFCIEALEHALAVAKPDIFNTDQGAQFTSHAFTNILRHHHIHISMNSKGRCLDNRMIERFWRAIKYENIYINDYHTAIELQKSIDEYITFYNHKRPHQSLQNRTPAQCYHLIKNQGEG